MSAILDFFAFRPVFTAWTLRLVWWAFLLETALSLIGISSAIYQTITFSTVLLYLPNLLDIVVRIALVRVFLELALLVIQRRGGNTD